jgi:Carboxypeptidase regulatory-like domain
MNVFGRMNVARGWLRPVVLLLAVLVGVIGPVSLLAQTVRGVVTRIGVPVPGVVVQLVDADATVVARTITDETGMYRLLAPRAGSYRLTTRRIGFAPTTSTPISLGAGETRVEALAIDGVAIRLDTVRVATAKGCLRLDAANSEVSAIWEQAKTALLATEATLAERTFSAALLSYRREIEPDGVQTLQSLVMTEIDSVTQPWTSRPVEELRKAGYVVRGKDDSTSYLAPGLDVLVSKQFAADHCFRLEDTDDDNVLGLAFQPAKPDRRLAELQGTMRVDRRTSELRSLEFRYTNLLPAVEKAGAGGRLEFARLRDGSWVISRWNIRMPSLAVAMPTSRGLRALMESATVAGINLAGGDLFVARRGTDTLWSRPLPTVAGIITDSVTGKPIAGARLRVRESGAAVFSDSAGRFDFGAMLPGQYTLLTNTPSLDSVGAVSGLALPVTDATASLAVRVPNAFRVLPAVCQLPADTVAARRHVGVVRGTVTRDSALRDSSAAEVVLQWRDTTAKTIRAARATADELGRFRFCDMPMGTNLEVRADLNAASSMVTVVQLDTISPFAVADLRVEPLAPDQGIVRGDVVDKSGAPLDNVSIEFPQLSLRATTDARGRYVLPRVPAGRQLVSVRRLGYSPADTTLVVAPGGMLEQRWVLENVTTLAEVNTTASRAWFREFDEHRRIGLGQFLTREELEKREAQRLGDLMVMMRGTKITRSGQSASYLATSRPRTQRGECFAHVWLDGNPMYLGRPSEPLYNLNELLVMHIEAIEYYAGPADTPAKYNNLGANCGVLVVHTRRD